MSSDSTDFEISPNVSVPAHEIELSGVRSSGPGGQNVNKVSSAIHLRFDVRASSLPEALRERLLSLSDRRISRDGVIVIKAQRHRSQERNVEDALERLRTLIRSAMDESKPRRPTRPTRGSRERRLAKKTAHGQTKALRRRVKPMDE
ncbi:MAG: alternative ribosome rescue aminoacyl-tRNA hydrolase ArfB [Acidihalobacter sp.]